MAKKYLDYDGLLYFWQKIKTLFMTDVTYDSTNRKIQKTKNGSTSDVVTIAKVATSGSYNDLANKPTIPSGVEKSTTTPKMDGTASIGSETKFVAGDHVHPTDTSRVPTSRTVNGKALTSDITLSASDVSALPSSTSIPTKTSDLTNDSKFIGATLSYYTGNIDALYTTSVYLYNTNSATGTFPTTTQYGTIVTIGGTSTNFAIQFCKTNDANKEPFIRFRSLGTWNDWVPISYTRGRLPSGTDLDNVKDSGSYMIASNNTYTNLPNGVTYGLLEVVPSTIANDTLLQRITTTSNVYFRFYSYLTWYGWKKIEATSA